MAAKKTKKPLVENSFYLYRWGNGYTTFLIANSPEDAIAKIKRSRDTACPPELQDEKILKKRLSEANQDFILTVSSGSSDEQLDSLNESESKELN